MKSIKKPILFVLLGLCLCLSLPLTACQKGGKEPDKAENGTQLQYKDGQYRARSELRDKFGGYGEVSLEIHEGKIRKITFEVYDKDERKKDENYGKDQNEGLYKIAQDSLKALPILEKELADKQNPNFVDSVSGATWNSALFRDAVRHALNQALPEEQQFDVEEKLEEEEDLLTVDEE